MMFASREVLSQSGDKTITMVSLNCENLFDCEHDSLKDDYEFLPDAGRLWNEPRQYMKINNLAREIIACSYDKTIPSLVALSEVENDSVLLRLTERSMLRNARYKYIMTNSPDVRGVDVALLYDPFVIELVNHHSVHIPPLDGMRPTRDLLYAKVSVRNTLDTLHVIAVHAPSRSGGEKLTRPNRKHVAGYIISTVDSIRNSSPTCDAKIIVAGDFNDYTGDASLRILEEHSLEDVSAGVVGINRKAKGTYKYQGEWDSLDHIFVSNAVKKIVTECFVFDAPFLLEEDLKFGGVKPKRCYVGFKWQNGFSDHLPLVMRIKSINFYKN